MEQQVKKTVDVRKMIVTALLCALAYAAVVAFSPIKVQFLSFEVKDCILAIGGFLYGPITAFISIVVVALIELVTISGTGIIGLLMNVLSSAFFLVPAAFIYKKMRTQSGAIIGLIVGVIATTAAMVLWNWVVTPWYMGVPRQVVEGMLLPLILPFNALKSSLNAVLTVVLYKSVVKALRKVHLIAPEQKDSAKNRRWIAWVTALLLLIVLGAVLLLWSGII